MQQATSYPQIVGQVIRGCRELAGMSLATMAQAASLSSSSGWSRVETGDTTMTLAQLRKAAHALNVEPWTIIQQTDLLVSQLAQNGVLVHDEKPKDVQKWLLGGAALLALVAGAAAAASLTAKGQPSAAGTSTAKKGEGEEDAQTTTKKASP